LGKCAFMTPRLLAVANMVKKSQTVADIGTDHAYIPVYLVLNELAENALAMDINKGPLKRADENILRFSLCDKIKTRLSDGLSELNDGEADTAILAGMGGILINNIIQKDKDRLKSLKSYILQPMTAIEETRKYLEKNGFLIVDEKLAKEDNKIYTVISAVPGEMKISHEVNYYIGEKLISNRDEFLPDLLCGKIYEYEKAIASMTNTGNAQTKEKLKHYTYLLGEFKRIREECAKW